MKIATLNVGTMTSKRHEIVRMMLEKKIEILCVQETKWAGSKAYGIGNGFKMFYHGLNNRKNGVGIIVSPELKDKIIEVGRKSDRVMYITLEIESELWTVVSCYAVLGRRQFVGAFSPVAPGAQLFSWAMAKGARPAGNGRHRRRRHAMGAKK